MNTSRGSAVHAYQRIASAYRDKIVSGVLRPGDRLPTEQELMTEYSVARQTVRQGLSVLVTEGLVGVRRPAGHYVRQREHMVYRPQAESRPQPASPEMDRYCQQISSEGRTPSQTIEVSIVPASADVARRLEVPEGQLVVARRRVRYINGEPVNTNDSHFPFDLVKDTNIMSPEDIPQGTNQRLAELGFAQARAMDEFFLRMPTPDEIARLDLAAGTPVGLHIVTGYTNEGRPVRCTLNLLPGDRHVIVYERAWE